MASNYPLPLQVDIGEQPRPGLLLKTVYRLYRERLGTWFAIIAPTSLIAAAMVMLVDYRSREIFRSIPRGEIAHHGADVAGAIVLRFGGFFLGWLLGCFALGAMATEISANNGNEEQGAWKHDAHQRTREHFGQLVVIALCTFCAFLIGMALASFVEIAAGKILGWQRFRPFAYWTGVAVYIVVCSIASWLGPAVPLLVKGDYKVLTAMKKSIELSSGYELAFLWLVMQTVAGSFGAWYVVHYLAGIFLPRSMLYTTWAYWGVVILALLASAAADPPIFIAFSLLSEPEKLKASPSMPGAQEGAHSYYVG